MNGKSLIKFRAATASAAAGRALMTAIMTAICLTGCGKDARAKYELRDQGIEAYNAGNYSEAIELFDKSLESSRGEVSELQYDILKYRGECELKAGSYEKAVTTYEAIAKLCDEKSEKLKYQSVADDLNRLFEIERAAGEIFGEGRYEDAYREFSKYASLDGSISGRTAWFNKAVSAEYLHNYQEAYVLLSEYMEKYPDDAKAAKEKEFCRTRSGGK